MSDIEKRIFALTPEKRELLLRKLDKEVVSEPDQLVISPVPRDGDMYPLSFSQERLWFLDQLEPGNVAYNIPLAVRLKGTLNVDVLEQSLSEIVRRHEALRTTFAIEDGQPYQRISPPEPFELSLVDLLGVPEPEREAESERLTAEVALNPFDLAKGPLFRATLLQLAGEEYILLLTMHHIVSDGWSIGVLIQELQALYQSFLKGQPSPLPELPIQYADFAHWQRQWMQGEVLETQLAYWKQKLGGGLPVLELPTDHPRPMMQTYQGALQVCTLPQATLNELKALSQQEGSSLFMTLLAAFNILLYRYTGQHDIVVGSPIANRNQFETEGLIGLFINNLVLRTDLSNNPSFRELLGRVREVALETYTHQDLPFEVLVEALQPERDASRSPLFQIMFILQNAPLQELKLPGLTLHPVEDEGRTAKFDLTLYLWEQPGEKDGYPEDLYISFEYNTDLFEASTIERMMGHFKTLLEAVITSSDQRILDLPLLAEEEWQQLLIEWNDTAVDYPKDQCIQHLIEAQVEQTPDSVAVVFGEERLTYRELNEQSNQLANYLQKLGVGPEVFVGIYMERSLEMMVGLLGILKAGGAYLPLDPSFPRERLAYMLEDSQARVLLTQKRLLNEAPEHQAQVVIIDEDWQIIAHESRENIVSEATPDDLAYVIYTSGSTGRPKGVQIEHRPLVNFLVSMRQQPGLTKDDILLAVTTLSFDIAGLELFLPLIVGAQVALISSADAADGSRLSELLDLSQATVMQATPATWRLLLAAGWQRNNSLKILCGGEAIPRDLADQLLDRSNSVWNLYGPTETTIWSTVSKVEPGDGAVSIGRPISNTQIYILDSHLQPVPIGASGNLYIGGDGLARGYLNRPELTGEKFIPNPFSDEPGSRIYLTGDLARYRPDGSIEFFGRIDHQVKIRGFRIELGEIETMLNVHPGISEAVAIVREDTPGDKRLVAYIVPDHEPVPTTTKLRKFLGEKLPDHMVPSVFVTLDALPLTPNGKVDRRALPAPDQSRPELEVTFVAPRTPVEEKVAKIWADLLGLEQVGIHDNFFELGGHSLLAPQVISRLDSVFEVKLSLRSFFDVPTIAELVAMVEKFGNGDTGLLDDRGEIDNLEDGLRMLESF